MWSRASIGAASLAALTSCASSRAYEDASESYVPEKGFFVVERQGDGVFLGNLSAYYGDTQAMSDAISSREFWNRAEQFCEGDVEKLSDGLCIVHWKAGTTDPTADPGWCKMDKFRCRTPA